MADLNALIVKTSDYDKDERYMATNDLCRELQRETAQALDDNTERRICAAVLKQLDDSSNDVQSIAVKCLGILLKKVAAAQIGEICDKLCTLVLEGKDELRDIYSIGLKTLITDVPEEMGSSVAERLVNRLLGGIAQNENVDIKQECLDNMGDLLRRFGHLVEPFHSSLMDAMLAQLGHDRPVVRKKATACVGALALMSTDPLLNNLVESILSQISGASIEEAGQSAHIRTLIQTIGTVSRMVGYRLGKHLDAIVPLFLRFCGDPADEAQQTDQVNELREHCFPGFESFVLRCPREVTPHIDQILSVALQFMRYDPNYCYDDDEEDEDDDEEDEMDDEEFEDDEFGASDDDDTSWKVRKSSVRLLSAIITSRPFMLQQLYGSCADDIIARFREREENVRVDVIGTMTTLLKSTMATRRAEEGGRGTGAASMSSSSRRVPPPTPALIRQRSAVNLLEERVPALVRAAQRQLASKSVKSKTAVLSMLRSLVTVLQGGLSDHLGTFMSGVQSCLQDRSQALKLDTMSFIRLCFELHSAGDMQVFIPDLLPRVTACVAEEWYKLIAEALRVITAIVRTMRPGVSRSLRRAVARGHLMGQPDGSVTGLGARSYDEVVPMEMPAGAADAFMSPDRGDRSGDEYEFDAHLDPIYEAVQPRLVARDIDQEIKECAITAMGTLVSCCGDRMGDKVPAVLDLLIERLHNEITRLPTLRTLTDVANSPLQINIAPVLQNAAGELAAFLRQQSRHLKQTTLLTLDALVTSDTASLTGDQVTTILTEAAKLITEADLHLTNLAITLIVTIATKCPSATSTDVLREHVLTNALELVTSPVLQGVALDSLVCLFPQLVSLEMANTQASDVVQALRGVVTNSPQPLPKQAMANVSKSIAAVLMDAPRAFHDQEVISLVEDLHTDSDTTKHLALLSLGELGQRSDLSSVNGLREAVIACFEEGSEETKAAAAYALGHLAVGKMESFLPTILESTRANVRQQYLLLSSLREIIVVHANLSLDFAPHLERVLPLLLEEWESDEEGVRNVVALCLGTLSSMYPERMIPMLLKLLGDGPSANARWTMVTSLRVNLSRPQSDAAADALLSDALPSFLELLHDEDLDVRRATLQLVNAAVHHTPMLIQEYMHDIIMPSLCDTVALKLPRVVDLGPFQHKVDDALPLRKAALLIADTALDHIPEKVDVGVFLPQLAISLADQEDVKRKAHEILIKLCDYAPDAVLGSVDILIDPLEAAVTKKIKDTTVGTDLERAMEIIRSGLRAVMAVSRVEDVGLNRRFAEFMERILRRENLVHLMEEMRQNEKSGEY